MFGRHLTPSTRTTPAIRSRLGVCDGEPGRPYYTFDVKAVTYIAGVKGEPIEGTTYCFPD
jgi:hypothetical protein